MDRPGHRRLAAAVAAVILVGLSIPAGVGALQGEPVPPGAQETIDPDGVLLAVDLDPDGSAVWRIEYRVRLDDDNATEAFESVQDEVDADPGSFTAPFAERMETTVAAAENATGREMALRDVTVATEIRQLPQTYGVMTYSFKWAGFAAVDGGRLRTGDAIDGLFLDGETRLLLSWPDGYRLVEASPAPHDARNRSAAWTGPLDFADGEPRVVVSSVPDASAPATTEDRATAPGPVDGIAGSGPPWAAAAVVVALLGAAGWFLFERRIRSPDDGADPSEELLSNEERVLRLLTERGGRMKQQEVAEALGWTDARTSQVVGNLRDAGEIESFRLGRENVLSLPGYDDT